MNNFSGNPRMLSSLNNIAQCVLPLVMAEIMLTFSIHRKVLLGQNFQSQLQKICYMCF